MAALQGALVDRARVVSKAEAGRVVDGETLYGDVYGDWFKCRLELGNEGESVDQATGERHVYRTPSLLYGVRDRRGGALELSPEDRLEVASPQLGTAVWDVVSAPQPLRKRRRVIGHQATLRRVETGSR